MKHSKLLAYFLAAFLFSGCKKEMNTPYQIHSKNLFVDSAVSFLKATLSNDQFVKLDLESVVPLIYRHNNIGLKIFEKGKPRDNFILLQKESQNFKAAWVNISGMESQSLKQHNGNIILEALDRKSGTKFIVKNNKVSEVIQSTTTGEKYSLISYSGSKLSAHNNFQARAENYELPAIVIVAYIPQDGYDNFYSLYWLFNQNSSYDGLYTSGSKEDEYDYESGVYSSGPSSGDNVSAAAEFISPDKPITAIKEEFKCFTFNSASTYNVSVNVNQPVPNSRDKINPAATFMAGHTFLTLEQINPDGSKIVRNVGFYPKNTSKPGDAVDQSIFGEDSNTGYDVSLKIPISGSELNSIINSLYSTLYKDYDLNNFNCVNAAIDALGSINVQLPATRADGVLFSGFNPADLGQDIRRMDLNTFSANNGNRKIERTVSNSNNLKPADKTGGC